MPVRKFKSIEDMPEWTWFEPGDPRLFEALREVEAFVRATVDPRFPPGVYKHRSIEDADRLCHQWADDNFARYRARLEETVAGT